jgi:hypothetical protein
MNTPDESGYFRFIEDTNKREMSNAETYDKALLTLSSVLLGLSLTFTQNVVPLSTSSCLWLLIGSWSLFALTITIVIASFIYGQHSFKRLKEGARKYFLEGETSANELSEQISNTIRNVNALSGISFITAILLFTIFVGINLSGGNIMNKDKKQGERIQPASTYEQFQTKPIKKPAQIQTQKPQQEQKK